MKIDWTKKLTSRKFWVAIIGFVTPLLLGFGMSEAMVDQTTSIIMAGGVLVAYILGESWTDAANAGGAFFLPNKHSPFFRRVRAQGGL